MSTEDKSIGCAECTAKLVLQKDQLGKKIYRCSRYPICSCVHGAHPDGTPMGYPADRETRILRARCHVALDSLWKNGECTREQAYVVLQKILRLSEADAHIGKLNKEQCLLFLREFDMLGSAVTILIPKPE